jgi:hypothetical protein
MLNIKSSDMSLMSIDVKGDGVRVSQLVVCYDRVVARVAIAAVHG